MLTKTGAKLLDFGLAKACGPALADGGVSMLPTTALSLTAQGTILGTFQYMAPEQLERHDADARTDLFALGTILYEMLTGRRAFEGNSQATLIAAIIGSDPPPVSQMQPLAPIILDRIVGTCVAKDPDERWQSARDLMRELRWAAEGGTSVDSALRTVSQQVPRPVWSRALPWVLAGGFAVALVAAILAWPPSRTVSAPTRITLSLPPDDSLTIEGGTAISPDGRTVAFAGRGTQGSRLYVRHLDQWELRALPSTDGATSPFFSADGRWIAFSHLGGLEKIPVSGGTPQAICKAATPRALSPAQIYGGHWQNDGTIIFATWPAGLWRVSSDGGTPQLITRPSEDVGAWYLWPEPVPGGGILFTLWQGGRTSIAVLAPGTDKPRILVESGARQRYLPTGHLVYVADSHLFAVPFDIQRLAVRGGATVVINDVNETPMTSDYDVSVNGSLVYLPAGSSAYNIVWKNRQGMTVPISRGSRRYSYPVLSQDGERLSVNVTEGSSRSIWTGSVVDGQLTRLTFGNDDVFGLWSKDDPASSTRRAKATTTSLDDD